MRKLVSAVVLAIGFAMVAFAARALWLDLRDDAAAQTEYAYLRGLARQFHENSTTVSQPDVSVNHYEISGQGAGQESAPTSVFSEINPDFTGWIVIPGTTIGYPVVRGADNSRYQHTLFSGAANPAGAIFMDYRCARGFNSPMCLIYGHNMRDGSMFSPLKNYLDQKFMNDHPKIMVLAGDGEEPANYRIFDARRTDAWDGVYAVDLNDDEAMAEYLAATDVERLLVLSTCISGTNHDARLLVFAALETQ